MGTFLPAGQYNIYIYENDTDGVVIDVTNNNVAPITTFWGPEAIIFLEKLNVLIRGSDTNLDAIIMRILKRFEVPEKAKGFTTMVEVIKFLIMYGNKDKPTMQFVYRELAKKDGITPIMIERRIKYLIDNARVYYNNDPVPTVKTFVYHILHLVKTEL